jgi:hypothetical protein
VVVAVTAGVVVEPVVVAAAMAWARAGRLAPSVFVAWEELRAAAFAPLHNPVLDANIVYISFVKGALDGSLYLYTVRALLLSLAIGLLLGLNIVAWRAARAARATGCAAAASAWGRLVGGGGGGLGVVLGAVAGAAGCCGLSVGGGGLLVAFGFSYTAATAVGERSTALQVAAVVILAAALWSTARTLAPRPAGR